VYEKPYSQFFFCFFRNYQKVDRLRKDGVPPNPFQFANECYHWTALIPKQRYRLKTNRK